MKPVKNLVMMFAAILIAFQINAQSAQTTEVKTEIKKTSKAPSAASTTEGKVVKTAVKADKKITKTQDQAAVKSTKKVADGRTKTGDKVYHDKKGPNGETVYIGPKGGLYYLDKKENKVYIK